MNEFNSEFSLTGKKDMGLSKEPSKLEGEMEELAKRLIIEVKEILENKLETKLAVVQKSLNEELQTGLSKYKEDLSDIKKEEIKDTDFDKNGTIKNVAWNNLCDKIRNIEEEIKRSL